jgi:methylated-DNA-protein-cysteine methyltransferase-like protein
MARAAVGREKRHLAVFRSTYERIYAVVRRIPRGRVATYGQVARLAGLANGARQVGYALHALREGTTVPWFRVLNARGASSLRDGHDVTQRLLLEREGVRFDAGGSVSLGLHGWRPRRRAVPRAASRNASRDRGTSWNVKGAG